MGKEQISIEDILISIKVTLDKHSKRFTQGYINNLIMELRKAREEKTKTENK